jgi:hypothetical protein
MMTDLPDNAVATPFAPTGRDYNAVAPHSALGYR